MRRICLPSTVLLSIALIVSLWPPSRKGDVQPHGIAAPLPSESSVPALAASPAGGGPKEKHALRQYFHSQLADLWTRSPLAHQAQQFLAPTGELSVIRRVGDRLFSAVVNKTHHLVAGIDIVLLRPEEPGALVTQSGDIDNRVKTLLDALSIPQLNQISAAGNDHLAEPVHCLFEDDNLITRLSVTVDRLLGSTDASEVLALTFVDVSATKGTFKNLELSL